MRGDTIYLYVLVDPFTNQPRYVGKTHEGIEKRVRGHMACKTHQPSSQWVHSLLQRGAEPIAFESEKMPRNDDRKARAAERFWIQYFCFIGADLTNRQFNGMDYRGRINRMTYRAKRIADAAEAVPPPRCKNCFYSQPVQAELAKMRQV